MSLHANGRLLYIQIESSFPMNVLNSMEVANRFGVCFGAIGCVGNSTRSTSEVKGDSPRVRKEVGLENNDCDSASDIKHTRRCL